MVLYAADISKLAVPVKSVQEKVKKGKRKVSEEVVEAVEPAMKRVAKKKVEPVEEESEELVEPVKKKLVVKKKVEPVEDPEEEKPEEIVEPVKKKRVVKKKVAEDTPVAMLAVDEVEPVAIPVPDGEEVEPVQKPKRVRKPKVDNSPPVWFQKYVQSVKKEEAMLKTEKVPAKQVKEEATVAAQKSWNDGLTRDRVANEVDSHSNMFFDLVNRMYQLTFGNRRSYK